MNRIREMLKVVRVVSVVLWFLAATSARGANPYVGTTGFNFLKIDMAARSAALGGASVASQEEISSTLVNPASLSTIRRAAVTATYVDYLLDTQMGSVAFGKELNPKTSWGMGIRYISYGDFQRTDAEHPAGEGLSSFEAGDCALQFSLSRTLAKNLFAGGAVKIIYSRIDTLSSDAYAFDLGLLLKFPRANLSVGVSALNMGLVRRGYFPGTKEALPVDFKLGLAYKLAHLPLLLVGDLNLPNDNTPYFSTGGEFTIAKMMFLRAGYNSLYRDLDREDCLSVGMGLLWKNYRIDYAYSSLAGLGKVQRLSITGKF